MSGKIRQRKPVVGLRRVKVKCSYKSRLMLLSDIEVLQEGEKLHFRWLGFDSIMSDTLKVAIEDVRRAMVAHRQPMDHSPHSELVLKSALKRLRNVIEQALRK